MQPYYLVHTGVYKPQISNQSSCHTILLLPSGIGVEVALVSLVLKKTQCDAVELKPWMAISDFTVD